VWRERTEGRRDERKEEALRILNTVVAKKKGESIKKEIALQRGVKGLASENRGGGRGESLKKRDLNNTLRSEENLYIGGGRGKINGKVYGEN